MVTHLTRNEDYSVNSVFKLDALYVSKVLDNKENSLKYAFYPDKQQLIVFGDYETVFVIYTPIENN